MTKDMPNISAPHLDTPDLQKLEPHSVSAHAPRILLLYGSHSFRPNLLTNGYKRDSAVSPASHLSAYDANPDISV